MAITIRRNAKWETIKHFFIIYNLNKFVKNIDRRFIIIKFLLYSISTLIHDKEIAMRTQKSKSASLEIKKKRVNAFTCSITGLIFFKPMITPCGHTFEEKAIRRHLAGSDKCPNCNTATITGDDLVYNYRLKDLIHIFLEENPDKKIDQFKSADTVLLKKAIETKNLKKLQEFINDNIELIDDAILVTGETALHYAIQNNFIAGVEFLLAKNANICARTQGKNQTPIQLAIKLAKRIKDWHIVELIATNRREDLSSNDSNSGAALLLASEAKKWDVAKQLLAANTEQSWYMVDTGYHSIHFAILNNNTEFASMLLAAEETINQSISHSYHTPLTLAAATKTVTLKTFQLILEQKDLEINKIGKNQNALWAAIHAKELDKAQLLLEQGININWQNIKNDNKTVLHLAAEMGYKDAIELLFKYNALDLETTNSYLAIGLAADNQHWDVVKQFIESKQTQYKISRYGGAMLAASHDKIWDVVVAIAKAKPSFYWYRAKTNFRTIDYAIVENRSDVINILVENGDDINFGRKDFQPPLITAIIEKKVTCQTLTDILKIPNIDLNIQYQQKHLVQLATESDLSKLTALLKAKIGISSIEMEAIIDSYKKINYIDEKSQSMIDYANAMNALFNAIYPTKNIPIKSQSKEILLTKIRYHAKDMICNKFKHSLAKDGRSATLYKSMMKLAELPLISKPIMEGLFSNIGSTNTAKAIRKLAQDANPKITQLIKFKY